MANQEYLNNSGITLKIYGERVDSSNPLPVISTAEISTDLEVLGKVAVGTTPVELVFSGKTESIVVAADEDNTGLIFIGKSNVDSSGNNGFKLTSTDSITLRYDDISNAVYVVSDTASQNVWVMASK